MNFFKKHKKISNFLSKRFDKKNIYGLKLTIFFILFVISLCFLLFAINSYINSGFITNFDFKISNLFFHSKNNKLITFFTFVTSIGNAGVIIFSLFIFSLFLKRKKYIIPLYISVSITTLITYLLKEMFKRPRPELNLYINQGFSFPSGHSSIIVAIYGFLIYFFLKNLKTTKNKIISTIICLFLIFSVAFSRLYLNVHYLSDVITGLLLGMTVLIFSIFISELLNKEK